MYDAYFDILYIVRKPGEYITPPFLVVVPQREEDNFLILREEAAANFLGKIRPSSVSQPC